MIIFKRPHKPAPDYVIYLNRIYSHLKTKLIKSAANSLLRQTQKTG